MVAVLFFGAAAPAGATVAIESTNPTPAAEENAEIGMLMWQEALSSRAECLQAASITFGQLSGRKGEYNTRTAVVTIDPDVPSERVTAVVVHELSHHAHLQCGAFADDTLTNAFYLAQGIPSQRPWFDYTVGWSDTPAELFAEAMTAVILGAPSADIMITADALSVVSAWMNSLPIPSSVTTPELPGNEKEPEVQPAPSAADPTEFAATADAAHPQIGPECGSGCVYVGRFAAD